jgi:hypothetical protein
MKLRRKIALGITTVFIAAATGHVIQGDGPLRAKQSGQTPARVSPPGPHAQPATRIMLASLVPDVSAPVPAAPKAQGLTQTAQSGTVLFPDAPETPAPQTTPCVLRIDMAAQPMAILGAALFAPCHPNERVVIQHEGLAISARTSETGALFVSLPALAQEARLTVLFPGGDRAEATLNVPEVTQYQRFAVQWQGNDAFQLHALEGGAALGTAGDISASNPQLPQPGKGFLSVLGDPTVDFPLLAEVYTFPTQNPDVRLVVEAAVTPQTCGREILAETLAFNGSTVVATDLTLSMPDCSAIGDLLMMQGFEAPFTLTANP